MQGPPCSSKGSDGGNGGNGGNSGKPGDTGEVTVKMSKGHKQEFKLSAGSHGNPGNFGVGKSGGSQGLGGCGEYNECSDTSILHHTKCKSFVECDIYRGPNCAVNKNGKNGLSGIKPSFSAIYDKTSITVDNRHLVDASPVFLDYLLKYAIILANEETMNEAQEILVFLTKYQDGIGQSANQLLDRMGKNGDFDSYTRPIQQKRYSDLTKKTDRLIRRGQRIENTLNKMGELFEFKTFVYDVLDVILEESEAYLQDLRLEEDQVLNDLSKSFEALQNYEYMLNMTTSDLHYKIELLTVRINQQIQSIQIAEKQQAMLSGLGAIAGVFMPWTWFSGSSMKAATEAAIHGEIASKLSSVECEDLELLNFLTEFAARYSVLGTDVALLRTVDDFKNFDRKTLKEFFQSGELR